MARNGPCKTPSPFSALCQSPAHALYQVAMSFRHQQQPKSTKPGSVKYVHAQQPSRVGMCMLSNLAESHLVDQRGGGLQKIWQWITQP